MSGRKNGAKRKACERYRARVGKPAGPGQPGSKRPKGWPENRTHPRKVAEWSRA